MILHWWLIPVIGVAVFAVGALYLTVQRTGGLGERKGGRTIVDKPAEVPHGKKFGWNYYK